MKSANISQLTNVVPTYLKCYCVHRSRGAGEKDHGGHQSSDTGNPCLGPGDLRRPVEGHGPADAPDQTELCRPETGAQVKPRLGTSHTA